MAQLPWTTNSHTAKGRRNCQVTFQYPMLLVLRLNANIKLIDDQQFFFSQYEKIPSKRLTSYSSICFLIPYHRLSITLFCSFHFMIFIVCFVEISMTCSTNYYWTIDYGLSGYREVYSIQYTYTYYNILIEHIFWLLNRNIFNFYLHFAQWLSVSICHRCI